MEERRGLRVKDLLIKLILIIVFIFLLIWLFPTPNLKPLNNQIFADNLQRMKDAAKSYYTVERLPKDVNTSKRMSLEEMIDSHLILPLMDSNGKYCSEKDSYVQITKLENEYIIKVQLSCSDKSDYIIEHYGCYDICSDKCKMLETTTTTTGKTAKVKTTKNVITTTKNIGKLYEYKYYKNVCTDKFAKYVCDSGYYLAGDKCIKNGSRVDTKTPTSETVYEKSTDEKPAKVTSSYTGEKTKATCVVTNVTSTQDASVVTNVTDEVVIKTQKVTANKTTTYDKKGAVGKIETLKRNYTTTQNYDVISATKIANTSSRWVYVSTLTTDQSGLAFGNDTEKLILVDSWEELTCDTCFTTVTVYKYYRYKKQTNTTYTYSCDAFSGYSLYDTNKCRKATNVTKSCPDSSWTDTGSGCEKKGVTTYSCAKYGSDYKLNESTKTCIKTTYAYSCPSGTEKTSDPTVCTKKVYGCKTGTSIGNGKCSVVSYTCPANTSTKTYTLNGTKCTVKSKVKVCSCPNGTEQTSDKLYCVKEVKKYTCNHLNGYTLSGDKCVKTTSIPKTITKCETGYTLTGNTCVKTVNTTDTKNAEKQYNTTCNKEYMWSTKTSVDGWIYTGTKREVK